MTTSRLVDISETPIERDHRDRPAHQRARLGRRSTSSSTPRASTRSRAPSTASTSAAVEGRDGYATSGTTGPRPTSGIMIHGFPNLFMPAGPQSGSASTNYPRGIETGVDWCTELPRPTPGSTATPAGFEATSGRRTGTVDRARATKMYSTMLMRKAKSLVHRLQLQRRGARARQRPATSSTTAERPSTSRRSASAPRRATRASRSPPASHRRAKAHRVPAWAAPPASDDTLEGAHRVSTRPFHQRARGMRDGRVWSEGEGRDPTHATRRTRPDPPPLRRGRRRCAGRGPGGRQRNVVDVARIGLGLEHSVGPRLPRLRARGLLRYLGDGRRQGHQRPRPLRDHPDRRRPGLRRRDGAVSRDRHLPGRAPRPLRNGLPVRRG